MLECKPLATDCKTVVRCKIEHFYNIFTSMAEPREVDGSKTFLQIFYFTSNHGLSDALTNLSGRSKHKDSIIKTTALLLKSLII